MLKFIRQIDSYYEKAVSYILVLSLLGILFLSVINILLRQFNQTIMWAEPFIRHLVFFSTFLGGVIATGKGNHIAIDIFKRFLESKQKESLIKVLNLIIIFISIGTIFWLIKAGLDFSKLELEYGKPSFWGIHSGVLTAITPLGFVLIAIRFFFQAFLIFDTSVNSQLPHMNQEQS